VNATIRTETPADYHQIAEVNALAFERMDEAVLVSVLRQNLRFDPELSLVAEAEGRIVGHVLLTPTAMQLDGALVTAAALAPLAVHPEYQRRGIGQRLLAEAHNRAQAKGHVLVYLLGHDTYYPQVGYRTHQFGHCEVHIARAELPESDVEVREVTAADVPALRAMWRRWFSDVDLVTRPGDSITEWDSTSMHVRSMVIECDGEICAFVRYPKDQPEEPGYFMATGAQGSELALAHLHGQMRGGQSDLILPVHPASQAAEWLGVSFTPKLQTWSAAMILPLQEHEALERYMRGVADGERPPGLVLWPVEFDVCC
jgi:predicted N-acetyltransferase YhbS